MNKIKTQTHLTGSKCPKKNISDSYSDIVASIVEANDDGILCYSTKEMLESFERYNKRENKSSESETKTIVGSMDAVSLFTRLEADKSSEIVIEETIRSTVEFENIDVYELGVYLRKNLTSEYIVSKGYDSLLQRKMKTNGKYSKKGSREYNKEM